MSSGRPQGTDYRAAWVQPDGTAVAGAAAGVELVRQRNTSGQQRFPDYSSYLRYQRGRVEVQRRAALRAMIAGGGPVQTVPDAPTSVSATAGNAEATVSFTAPANNGGSAITGYTVTASPGGATASGASSPITVTGLSNGTAYTFTVVATNSVGDSVPSAASLSATPATVPGAPTGLSVVTNGGTFLDISFTPPSSNGGSSITNYKYSTDNGITYTTLVTPDIISPITISGLTENTEYSIKLIAMNAVGDGSASASLTVTTGTAPTPPAPGTQLLVNSGFTLITNNGADNWASTRGWQSYSETSASSPTAVLTMPTRDVYPTSSSTGFIIFSFISATVSQTVSIESLSGINQITGVLNVANTNNRSQGDTFTFQIQYKNSTGSVLYTSTTNPTTAPSAWTDYTLTLTRASSPNFDSIKSITVSITGIDTGYWNGQYGPAVDYCTLTVS